ncbi:MAG: hypothetical protein HY269_08485 [Deltaproteobacteria bacterium]|nr:hypothetical protein [Deltaproteobacteria bacterium]
MKKWLTLRLLCRRPKSWSRHRLAALSAVALISLCSRLGAKTANARIPFTLGDAAGFVVLSTGSNVVLGNGARSASGDIGGSTVASGNYSYFVGNIVAGSNFGTAINFNNYVDVDGSCITGGGSILLHTGAVCDARDTSGSSLEIRNLNGAAADASVFAATLASAPADQTLPSIVVPDGRSSTITCSPSTGVFIVNTGSITLGGSAKLNIDCAASNFAVINVTTGQFKFGHGAKVQLSGGIAPDGVVFNIEGTSATPGVAGGNSAQLLGTILSASRPCSIGVNFGLTGALICGGAVNVSNQSRWKLSLLRPIP